MRIMFFSAVALLVITILALAQAGSPPSAVSVPETLPQHQTLPRNGDGIHMWRKAAIRVMPLDMVSHHRATLDSLRTQVALAERESMKFTTRDPLVREQLSRQLQLMYQLLDFAELQNSDRDKGPAVLQVQHHLNEIEGQLMCEACHTSVNAQMYAGGH
jgi:hypothetical protein